MNEEKIYQKINLIEKHIQLLKKEIKKEINKTIRYVSILKK